MSNDEIEVLKTWVYSNSQVSHQMNFVGQRTVYFLGGKEYEAKGTEERANWEDFFERLQKLGFVILDGYDKSNKPQFKLKKAAFDYIKRLT